MTKDELLLKLEKEGFGPSLVKAFRNVDREAFIPPEHRHFAYADMALPIGEGQTISQPYTIAFMLSLLGLGKHQKILEVGSGSGYVLALIDEIVEKSEIYGTEILSTLVDRSKSALKTKQNIRIYHTPDSLGLESEAPFDRILVSAAAERLPQALTGQLSDNGIMVCPVQNAIVKAVKKGERIETEDHYGFTFVPLITEGN